MTNILDFIPVLNLLFALFDGEDRAWRYWVMGVYDLGCLVVWGYVAFPLF